MYLPSVQAVRKGHWIVLDELNLAPTEVLEALNRQGAGAGLGARAGSDGTAQSQPGRLLVSWLQEMHALLAVISR